MNKSRSINIKKIEIKHQSIWIKVLLYTEGFGNLKNQPFVSKTCTLIKSVIKAHFNGNEKEKKRGKYTLHIKVTK